MTRFDLYTSVHKGLRSALFSAAECVARTDFASAAETSAARSALVRLLDFLDEHAEHEDAAIQPIYTRSAPELAVTLAADHARVEGLGRDLRQLLARFDGASEAERIALGRRVHGRMGPLIAEHMLHMEREEGCGQRALWAHCTDEVLLAVHGQILGSIPPARLAEWLELILPALGVPEAAGLVGGLSAEAPAEVAAQLLAKARSAMGEVRWAQVAAAPLVVGAQS